MRVVVNQLYNENCLDTMARMPDGFLDLTVTSPPYDDTRVYNGYSFDFEPTARELFRVTKKGGVVVWVVNDATKNGSESGTSFKQALYFKEIGFNLHDTMIYRKINYPPQNHRRCEQCFEYMFVLSKGAPRVFNGPLTPILNAGGHHAGGFRNKNRSEQPEGNRHSKVTRNTHKLKPNIWEYKVGSNQTTADTFAFQHPAIFPEALANDHILTWSNPGDLVYDPFSGSGTTAKQSILNNRNWIASEMSPGYCKLIEERVGTLNLLRELGVPCCP